MKVLTGLIRVFSGDIFVDGSRLRENRQALGRMIGLPFEHALETSAKLSGVGRPELNNRIGAVQRIRIAQAPLHDPEILVIDEPLSGLDPSSRFDVKNILRKLKAEGKTVLLSSHILSDIEDLADRIAIFHEGKLLKEGTSGGLQAEYRVGTVLRLETDSADRAVGDLERVERIEKIEVIDRVTIRLHIETAPISTLCRETFSRRFCRAEGRSVLSFR